MTETVNYKGKKFKVIERRTKATYACEGKDDEGNPKSRFISTKMLTPKQLEKREEQLYNEYDTVEMTFAHEITTLFREVINQGDDGKDVQIVHPQRQFKNGKWSVIDPLKETEDVEDDKVQATMQKLSELGNKSMVRFYALWAIIIAAAVYVGALLTRIIRGG